MNQTEIMVLLREIAVNTKSNAVFWTGFFTVAGTLVAGTVGYLVTRYRTITAEQLKWLRELRDLGADFFSSLDFQYNLLKRPINPQTDPAYQTQLDKLSQEIMHVEHRLLVRLNRSKPNQKRLSDAADGALAYFMACVALRNKGILTFNDQSYAGIKREFFSAMGDVGADTWKQVRGL